MILFNSDYLEGAHPKIMERLLETNMEQTPGYGEDEHCREAAAAIRRLCHAPEADVHFLVGGTQTNATVLSALLRPYQGVISADTGHIAVHETGAIEACGHKVIALPASNGKLDAGQISECCRLHFSDESHEHMVMPAAVYISNPTEVGTLYSREELIAMRAVCDRWNLTLYLDGARLGYGLASPENTLDLPFLAHICDAFYIGGTKQGLLFGEALVISSDALKPNFRYMIKRQGGMLAKGRLLGVQFEEVFKDGLYFKMSEHAIQLAMRLKQAMAELGIPFLYDSPTNQQFPILPDAVLNMLRYKYSYATIQRVDSKHTAVRFCTSWATKEKQVDSLIADLKALF
ncbi:MAG: beta-eliminating lyase-related protein [Clostridia bacterium]|nr:beta-eliminating lyase-related protein [Clostridia bacterium]